MLSDVLVLAIFRVFFACCFWIFFGFFFLCVGICIISFIWGSGGGQRRVATLRCLQLGAFSDTELPTERAAAAGRAAAAAAVTAAAAAVAPAATATPQFHSKIAEIPMRVETQIW